MSWKYTLITNTFILAGVIEIWSKFFPNIPSIHCMKLHPEKSEKFVAFTPTKLLTKVLVFCMFFDWYQWPSTCTLILTVFLESSNNTGNSNIHIDNPQSHIFLFWAWWLQLNPLCLVKDTLRISTNTSYSITRFQILSPAMHCAHLKASFLANLIRSCPIDTDSYFCLPVCLYWLSQSPQARGSFPVEPPINTLQVS